MQTMPEANTGLLSPLPFEITPNFLLTMLLNCNLSPS